MVRNKRNSCVYTSKFKVLIGKYFIQYIIRARGRAHVFECILLCYKCKQCTWNFHSIYTDKACVVYTYYV